MTKKKANDGLITGLLLGSMIGTVVGLLFSPRSGKENRKIIKKSVEALPQLTEDLTSSVKLQTGRLSKTTITKLENTLDRLQEAIAAGIEASQEENKKEE
jgi:gas vesicle protein